MEVHLPALCPAVRQSAALVLVAHDLKILCKDSMPCFVEFQLLGPRLLTRVSITSRNVKVCVKIDWLVILGGFCLARSLFCGYEYKVSL